MERKYMKENGVYTAEINFTDDRYAVLYNPDQGFGFITGTNRAELPVLKIPEANSGFLHKWWYEEKETTDIRFTEYGCIGQAAEAVSTGDIEGRYIPLCYRQDVPRIGSYRLTVTVWAEEDDEEVLLFTGRRRLAWRGPVPAGQRVIITAMCDVSPIIPRGQKEPLTDLSICTALVCSGRKTCLQSIKIEETDACVIYIMGDSTVTDQTGDFPYAPGASYSGWGQMLGAFLPDGYSVSNHAHSGLTTESFRSEGHWDIMASLIKPGDYCLMQFGHNDQKLDFLKADEGYTRRIEQYIEELRAKEAVPVLVTPLARNSWCNPEQYNDLLADYAKAVFDIGKRFCVPVLDLHGYAKEQIKDMGMEAAKQWFFPSDYTHTNDFGAYKMAAFLSKGLCRIINIEPKLLEEWRPCGPFTTLTPPADCKFTPPEKTADALEVFASQRPNEAITRVECLELTIQRMRFFPINVYNDLYEDVVGHETYAGTVQCAAQNHMIPSAFVKDGKLHPDQPVTLQEFLAVLMPAYASRKKLKKTESAPEGVADYAKEAVCLAIGEQLIENDAAWDRPVTRKCAAEMCRCVQI
ncbi:rhamnogalacturonan acetylesterase [Hungatella hathewayi]|uniref:rhamnogalacturonan acetylesterase n=1 Tax=Hungatella hathewayi TaxID=154046 RepID=UPI003564199D